MLPIQIRDPGSGDVLTPGSRMGKIPDPGLTSRIISPRSIVSIIKITTGPVSNLSIILLQVDRTVEWYLCRQCSGSVCFWASWIRIRNLFVQIWILPSKSKKLKKNLDFYCFWLLYDLFYRWRMMQMYLQKGVSINKKIFWPPWRSLTKRAGSGAGSVS